MNSKAAAGGGAEAITLLLIAVGIKKIRRCWGLSHIVCRTTGSIPCCGLQLMMITSMMSRVLALGSEGHVHKGMDGRAARNCYKRLSRSIWEWSHTA